MKALAKMEPISTLSEQVSLTLDFPSPDDLRPPLITLEGASVGYVAGNRCCRASICASIPTRIALLGRNGNGKTTLARLLSGQLPLMAGTMKASGKLRVGYFAQHQVEELIAEDTPLQHMSRVLPAGKPEQVRAQLARFGFSGDKALVEVRPLLSGGERARLALALLTRDAPHLIILDEPTNHLDVDARDALVEALNDYGGAVMVVSHDRHLLELTADRLLLVAQGTATDYAGSLDELPRAGAERGRARRGSPHRREARDAQGRAAQRGPGARAAAAAARRDQSGREGNGAPHRALPRNGPGARRSQGRWQRRRQDEKTRRARAPTGRRRSALDRRERSARTGRARRPKRRSPPADPATRVRKKWWS